MSRQPRFEIVHTGPRQFHARFRAANGEVVWVTETYKRRRAAGAAIALLSNWFGGAWECEIREVDER